MQTDHLTGCDKWRVLVSKYDWNTHIAMAVMEAESSCVEAKIGDDYPILGLWRKSCGLFQVRTLDGRPACEQLKDPAVNVDWAYKIYSAALSRGQDPWSPWSVYKSGKYKQYLK